MQLMMFICMCTPFFCHVVCELNFCGSLSLFFTLFKFRLSFFLFATCDHCDLLNILVILFCYLTSNKLISYNMDNFFSMPTILCSSLFIKNGLRDDFLGRLNQTENEFHQLILLLCRVIVCNVPYF